VEDWCLQNKVQECDLRNSNERQLPKDNKKAYHFCISILLYIL